MVSGGGWGRLKNLYPTKKTQWELDDGFSALGNQIRIRSAAQSLTSITDKHWNDKRLDEEKSSAWIQKYRGNLFPDRPFKTNMGNMCRQINFWESSINNHLLPHFLTLSKLWYTAYDCLIYKQCFHEANSNQRLLQISMHCQRLENRVFSLSKSEVEHKLMLHWFSAQIFFQLDSVLFSAVHMASCIFSTSPNRVHKTTVKQMVISPSDSLTFEK